jgi:hypothetical protein
VLEKNGLGPAAAILENYGIDSETDLLVLDQDDFSKLASRGLKPLYEKKLGLVETLRFYGQVSHGHTVCFHLGTICQWYTSLYEIALWFHEGNILRHWI